MGLLDVLGKVNDKLASPKMQAQMRDGYMKGKISKQQYDDYLKALAQYYKRRGM